MKLTTAEYGFPQLWRLRYAYREMLEWHLIRVSLGVLGAGVLLLTVLGPIGIEDGFGPMHRFAFVTLCSVFCWPLCHALSSAILYLARSRQPLEILLACAAGELFMAVPCGAVVYALFGLFQPHEAADFTLLELYLNTAVLILACRSIIHYVACQAVDPRRAETAGQETVAPMQDLAETPGPAAGPVVEAESRQRLFERLPTMVGRDIIYLTVSGHYVNVITTEGSCLVLMRLVDAIAALGDLGLRVHRSYWVAYHHIAGVQRRDGQMALRLTGSHAVPVSRTHSVAADAAASANRDPGSR